MVSKKYILIAGLLGLLQTATFAQTTTTMNDASDSWVMDSSKVSTKSMPQHNEFMNNAYPYPSKPRSMWELGFGGGLAIIGGDVASRAGYGGSISLRKSLGHVISLRAAYFGSINYGIDNERRSGLNYETGYPPTIGNDPYRTYANSFQQFMVDYRTEIHQLSLDALISLNSMSHYRGNPKADWYVLVGYSIQGADVDVRNPNSNGTPAIDFSTIDLSQTTGDIQKAVKAAYDNINAGWVNAPVQRGSRYFIGRVSDNWLLMHGLDFGGGVAFRLSDRVNFAIEQRFTVTGNDNLDGIVSGASADIQSNSQVRLNFNLGNTTKRVLPLWWLNPNNYVYNEVNAPKHMKLPPVVLPDADGDGVTDQFDMEPNTPKGCAVDTHGVSLDTDGDGVPDCRDKEKLTPQNCFPVDADGVGKCPEPPCCDSMRNMAPKMAACSLGSLPSVTFKGNSVTISKDAQALLASAASQINANPDCKVKVIGYGASSKSAQQLSWDRVNAVINYLVSKQGISENRMIFTYGQSGDANTVDLQGTTEDGPNTVPAPHPNLQKSK